MGLLDRLARPFLMALDPEDAHGLTIKALKHLPLPPALSFLYYPYRPMRLAMKYGARLFGHE